MNCLKTLQSYFCGQGLECVQFNNPNALQRAKANIEELYPVVGVLEMMHQTILTLMDELPEVTKGIYSLYRPSEI